MPEINEIIRFSGSEQKDLIHILHRVQAEFGYVPPEAVSEIARQLNITASDIYGVLTFYKAFSLKPRGAHLLTICMGTACHVRGAPMILDEVKRRLKVEPGQTTEDRMFTLETVNCVGACALGPIVIADGTYHGQMKTREVGAVIDKFLPKKKKNSE